MAGAFSVGFAEGQGRAEADPSRGGEVVGEI
jgi:hypothetical protein